MPVPSSSTRLAVPLLLLVGVAAASFSYLGHHSPTLGDHGWSTVLLVIVGSAAAAAALSAVTLSSPAPAVVVARPAALRVRELSRSDLRHVARLHADALPHGFLTKLGQPFLRAYDRTFADSPHAVAYVAEVDGHPVGFLLGVTDPGRHAGWMRRERRGRLATLGVLGLATHPVTARHFLRTRVGRYLRAWRGGRGRRGAAGSTASVEPAVLSHIAVEAGGRGSGAGRLLVERFLGAASAAGVPEARLLTLTDDDGAGAFYRRLGWRPCGERPGAADAPAMIELSHDLRATR